MRHRQATREHGPDVENRSAAGADVALPHPAHGMRRDDGFNKDAPSAFEYDFGGKTEAQRREEHVPGPAPQAPPKLGPYPAQHVQERVALATAQPSIRVIFAHLGTLERIRSARGGRMETVLFLAVDITVMACGVVLMVLNPSPCSCGRPQLESRLAAPMEPKEKQQHVC
jgi:hypothetical protein